MMEEVSSNVKNDFLDTSCSVLQVFTLLKSKELLISSFL